MTCSWELFFWNHWVGGNVPAISWKVPDINVKGPFQEGWDSEQVLCRCKWWRNQLKTALMATLLLLGRLTRCSTSKSCSKSLIQCDNKLYNLLSYSQKLPKKQSTVQPLSSLKLLGQVLPSTLEIPFSEWICSSTLNTKKEMPMKEHKQPEWSIDIKQSIEKIFHTAICLTAWWCLYPPKFQQLEREISSNHLAQTLERHMVCKNHHSVKGEMPVTLKWYY